MGRKILPLFVLKCPVCDHFLSLSLSFFFLFFFSWYLQVEKRTLSNHNTVSPPIFSLSLEIERDSKVGNDFIDECSKHTLIKCVYSSSNQCFSRVKRRERKKMIAKPNVCVLISHTLGFLWEAIEESQKKREKQSREEREKKKRKNAPRGSHSERSAHGLDRAINCWGGFSLWLLERPQRLSQPKLLVCKSTT